ncbi:MAG: endonuclease/exonuclease/phosphatase family protein [Bacteroidales bacterium]|nr:endonuclease/exonuclease/phosphatase family protein [Bacteroidales bacterium]
MSLLLFAGKVFASIMFLVTVFFAILSIISAYSDHLSPATYSAFPSYLAFAFPLFLVINMILIIFWIFRKRWFFAIPLAAILAGWPAVSAFFPVHLEQEVPENAIKLLTYNVQHFELYASHKAEIGSPILHYILEQKADIICMQEYAFAYKNGKMQVHQELKEVYPYYSSHDVINVNNVMYNGLAVFSTYPILDAQRINYPSEHNGSVLVKVNVNGKILNIINNHLETNRITEKDRAEYATILGDLDNRNKAKEKILRLASIARNRLGVAFKIRAEQADSVACVIDKLDGYIIACGDFNDPPNSYSHHRIKGDKLRDAFADSGFGMSHTYNENKFYFRIDHILYSPNIKVFNCKVDNQVKYSDHYPMSCYFTFEK